MYQDPQRHLQLSRARQGEGKEPGEILEVPLSPAKAPCRHPRGSTNYPPSPLAKPRTRAPYPFTNQQETKTAKIPNFVARRKKRHPKVLKSKLKLKRQSAEPAVSW